MSIHEPPAIDTTVAHSPRVWNYWLGGEDHYEADRRVGDHFRRMFPPIVDIARASRSFLGRAVGHLAGEAGVRQFLDIGTGLPTRDNTHEVAQRAAADARVVYVDNDPVVLAHARARMPGAATHIDADLHDTARILDVAAGSLAFDRPVAVMLMNILGHVPDFADARRIVGELMSALAPGSYLVVADGTTDGGPFDAAVDMWNQVGSLPYVLRSQEQFTQYFDGLEVLEPGVVPCALWRPDPSEAGRAAPVEGLGAVGRKP